MRQRKGFTLIELLVVIAIIALLVSILAPSLTQIMAGAKDTKCKANLNSIGKSMLGFGAQNNGAYPSESIVGFTTDTTQVKVLTHFAYDQGIKGELFLCPAVTTDKAIVPDSTPGACTGIEGSYSYQDAGKPAIAITDETKNDVVFLADKKIGATTTVSTNHESGEFMFYASKAGTYKSPVDDNIATLNPATFGRAGNNIFKPDTTAPAGGDASTWTLRDDSELLRVDE